MKKTNYHGQLLNAFNCVKQLIKENERVPIVDTMNTYRKKEGSIQKTQNGEEITIYSLSPTAYNTKPYIHLSGVNIMFYLVCLYLRAIKQDMGIYCEKEKTKKITLLKMSNFIFEEDEKGYWYYPISQIKEFGAQEGFIFDLPKLPTMLDDDADEKIRQI